MKNRINGPQAKPEKLLSTGDTIGVIGLALAVIITGTAFTIKKCTGERESDEQKIEKLQTDEPAYAKNGSAHKPKHQPQRDTTQEDAPESSLILSDDDQPTLEESCQEVKDSVTYDDPGAIYDAFATAQDFMPDRSAFEDANDFLRLMSKTCGMSEAQLLGILKKTVDQGDTRIAGFLNDYITSRCSDEGLRELTATSKQLRADFDACETPREKCEKPLKIQGSEECENIPWTDEDGKVSCMQPYWDNMKKQCETLPHDTNAAFKCSRAASSDYDQRIKQGKENEHTCPDRIAQEIGTDLQNIQSLNAQAVGNKLATLRLALLDPASELSEDLIQQYMGELRQFLISKDVGHFLPLACVHPRRKERQVCLRQSQA